MTIDKETFKNAINPLEKLLKRQLTVYELKYIYYFLFDSPTKNDFEFVILKYAKQFYFYNSITRLEIQLIIDIFEHYGLTHRDLESAFKLRIQKVLSKARDWPTPSELLVLVRPNAIINIYDSNERKNVLNKLTPEEIKEKETNQLFKAMLGKY